MIASDDPAHQEQRRLVSRGFTPKAVRRHEDVLAELIDELLDPIDGEVEVVDALAAQLPARMTARLLGFPEENWREVKSWSERLMRLDTQLEDPAIEMAVGLACMEFNQQLIDMVPARRECPVDDLVSAWANAYEHDKVFNETGLFIAGGAETTRTAIAHGLRAFADHPDQWDRLAAEPDLVPTAVDEVIRWVTPLNNFFRTAVVDSTIGDQAVAEGDRVILLYPSANRDEAVFERPLHLRHHPQAQPPRGLRLRHPLLHRGQLRQVRAGHALRRADPPVHRPRGRHRARRRAQHLRQSRPHLRPLPHPPLTVLIHPACRRRRRIVLRTGRST